jgi:hypothetical protein
MSALTSEKQQQLLAEVEGLPEEYFPLLLEMIRAYRESVLLKPAADSFRRGWQEAQGGETVPVDRLWGGIEQPLVAHSPRLQAMVEVSHKQIQEGDVLSHEEFWAEVEASRASKQRGHK